MSKSWLRLGVLIGGLWPSLGYCPPVISNPVTMNFGDLEFTLNTSTASANLGTDGFVTYTGDLGGSGVGTPGQVLITGKVGDVFDVSCAQSFVIEPKAGTALTIRNIEYVQGLSSGVSYGSAISCQGEGNVTSTHTVTKVNDQDSALIGGQLEILSSSGLVTELYERPNGSNPSVFTVIKQ